MAMWQKKDNFTRRHPRTGGSFFSMLPIALVMCALMLVLTAVVNNVSYTLQEPRLELLAVEKQDVLRPEGDADCLLIYEEDAAGLMGRDEMTAVLSQMKVRFDALECWDVRADILGNYSYLVLSVTHYQYLGNVLGDIKAWVKAGGNLMILYPPEVSGSFRSLFDILGIRACGNGYAYVEQLRFSEDFLLGASRDFTVIDPYDSSMSVYLEDDCEVFAQTTEEYPVPIVWRRKAGLGTVVVDNLGFLQKGYRGIHCAAYSLLSSACVYPVINAAAFYIDDFPSPVPSGYAKYIERDYNLSIKDFYTSRWWTDTYNLAKKYGFQYTGMVIEEYSDQVSGPFDRNRDTERYQYFGNMLLSMGGEIGFHGYNHMPLVLENFDYMGLFDSYSQWRSYEDMLLAVTELKGFCSSLYPDCTFRVYVPPSNIISQDGIDLLASNFPDLKAIAAVYLPGELAYCQEFRVEDNGIVSTPRVISGYILDDYARLVALSELNFHLVSSHFQHPDDVLDEERGAELGWANMFANLSDYVDWLYTSVPAIRSTTGSEMAAAVQRYDYIEMTQTRSEDGIRLDLVNFYDEAWFLLRINDGREIAQVTGGECSRLGGMLHLIHATSDTVEISFT